MDSKTIKQYNKHSKEYAEDWLNQEPADDMYKLLKKYFKPGKTIDLGCGAGRDTYWLSKNGFSDVIGVDASEGLLEIAGNNYSDITFKKSTLPELTELKDLYQNILCETVIMHLCKDDIVKSVKRLKSLLVPGGILYLSWRLGDPDNARSTDSRLYTFFDKSLILEMFAKSSIVDFHEKTSLSSGKTICRLIYSSKLN